MLSNFMKPEDQIKALAELDGWKRVGLDVITPEGRRFEILKWENVLPNYLTSYDAIIPLIQRQDANTKGLIYYHFNTDQSWTQQAIDMLDATPSQLSEAILRATGRWVE